MSHTYQAHWTCSLCGSGSLLVHTHAHCPNCGHAYDGEPVHYPAWDDLVPPSAHRFHGDDWHCCDHGWADWARYCGRCGERPVRPLPLTLSSPLVH